jgi:hypothetical protein
MEIGLRKVLDHEGKPISFARLNVYEPGPNGRLLATAQADVDGLVPALTVEDRPMVKIELVAPPSYVIATYDDVAVKPSDGQGG